MNELSYGQKAVGLTFNPSGDDEVHRIKSLYAEIIDTMTALTQITTSDEATRLALQAITEAQGAQMWAVKAITWRD